MNSHPTSSQAHTQVNAGFGQRPTSRSMVLTVLSTSLSVGEVRFARRLALSWLTSYPGDLQISLLHARALIQGMPVKTGKVSPGVQQALPILENLVRVDPEYVDAQEAYFSARQEARQVITDEEVGNVLAVGGKLPARYIAPAWSKMLLQSRQALAQGRLDVAENLVHQALMENPASPLAAITHLQAEMRRSLPVASIRSLAAHYHERFPDCLIFNLILADSLMDGGDAEQAVALIHQVVSRDVAGQVAKRLWADKNPYRSLWPDDLVVPSLQDVAVPAAVAAVLGWNQLPEHSQVIQRDETGSEANTPASALDEFKEAGPVSLESMLEESAAFENEDDGSSQISSQAGNQAELEKKQAPGDGGQRLRNQVPESLQSVQAEFERVARKIKQPDLARADGRYPIYVILTTRKGLEGQYSPEAAIQVNEAMNHLAEAVRARNNWGALVYYADEGYIICTRHGSTPGSTLAVKPAKPEDPWSLKLALADLDAALGKRGEMIGAVLIVGGPEIVPFHRLPNPLDDVDAEVASDNPYGTRDENYFIPEWPVGRIPGGAGPDPEPLLKVLERLAQHQFELARREPRLKAWFARLIRRFWPSGSRIRPSMGYSAAIWRQASLSVYHPIGEAKSLLVSPPVHAPNGIHWLDQEQESQANASQARKNGDFHLHPVRMGYFNLHGLVDAVEWYGQKDPSLASEGPDYPVALRPEDICNGNDGDGHASPQVIFSEACYGAYIQGRKVDESVAMKFMVSGSLAVVGSTCTAYGSISTPLAAADLLGFAFWNFVNEGLPAGEALRRARIHLAREMHHRQGYLDGEDQKTLISFVLYGDPLAQPRIPGHSPKSFFRTLKPPAQVKMVCDREDHQQSGPVSPDVMIYVKNVVSQYLPAMADAQLAVTQEHASCQGNGCDCPTAQMGAKARPSRPVDRKVITLSKQVQQSSSIHRHYARLTLDSQGKLVKLVVSR